MQTGKDAAWVKPHSKQSDPAPKHAVKGQKVRRQAERAPRIDMAQFKRSLPSPPERTLWELIEEKTGQEIPLEQIAQWERRREDERQLQLRVARAMGKNGRAAARTAGDAISVVGLMSGYAEQLVKTPRRNCFAWVSRSQRRELLLNLTYYLAHRPGCRHIRLTQGPRVPLTQIGKTFRRLAKIVSRINGREWFCEKAEIGLRCSELAWEDGERTAHVHVHLLVRPVVPLSEADWVELEGHVRQVCAGDVSDFEPLGDPAAAGPYLTKANDLTAMSGQELRTYAEELRHVRTHEPLGEFRAFCRELKESNMKLTRIHGSIVRVHRSDGMRRVDQLERALAHQSGKQSTPPVNRLLRLGQPRPHGSTRSEPALYIKNYDGDLEHVLEENPDMRCLRDRLMPQWPRRPRQTRSSLPIVPTTTGNRPTAPATPSTDQPSKSSSSPSSSSSSRSAPCCGAAALAPNPSVTSLSTIPAGKARIAHPAAAIDADDNGDVAPAPLAPMSPFLRGAMDRFRHFLDEPPEPAYKRKRSRSVRAPATSTEQPRPPKPPG